MKQIVMRNPGKNYGRLETVGDLMPTLLATDYKSPPLCIEQYEDDTDESISRWDLQNYQSSILQK